MIDVKVTGLEQLREQSRRLAAVTQRRVGSAIEQTAAAIVEDAQGRAPVRTGRLRAALAVRLTRAANRIGARIEVSDPVAAKYALYVELGTVHAPAQPFLNPALHGQAARHEGRLAEAGRAIESELAR